MTKKVGPLTGQAGSPTTFGALVRAHRKSRKESLRTFAARLAVTPAHIADIEQGRRAPGSGLRERLCRDLGLETTDLALFSHERTSAPSERAEVLARSSRPCELVEDDAAFWGRFLEASEYGWASERHILYSGPTRATAHALARAHASYASLYDSFNGRDLGPGDVARCLLVGTEWTRLITTAWRNTRTLLSEMSFHAFIEKMSAESKKLAACMACFPRAARHEVSMVPNWQGCPTPPMLTLPLD